MRRIVLVLSLVIVPTVLACSQRSTRAARPAPPPAAQPTADARCDAGQARLESRDYAGAAEEFDRCIQSKPDEPYFYYYAGMAYQQLRRLNLMSARFERFLDLAPPDAPERPRVQAILRGLRG